jgi:hypothetical protein
MSTTHPTRPAAPDRASPLAIVRTGVVAAVVAAVAAVVVAAVADAIDVPLVVSDEEIPLGGFATLTLFASTVGVVLAAALARWTRRARTEFLVVTVALVALSLVPVVDADAETATKVALTLAHLTAAAVVIPALASRLRDR